MLRKPEYPQSQYELIKSQKTRSTAIHIVALEFYTYYFRSSLTINLGIQFLIMFKYFSPFKKASVKLTYIEKQKKSKKRCNH